MFAGTGGIDVLRISEGKLLRNVMRGFAPGLEALMYFGVDQHDKPVRGGMGLWQACL